MDKRNYSLPIDVRNRILRGVHLTPAERTEAHNKFVEKFLKLVDDDVENFSNIALHLNKVRDKKVEKQPNKKNTKKLNYRQRKELGLYTLGRKSLKYKDLKPLHELWKEYMTKYLNLDELRQLNWTNSPEDANFDQVSLKLFRADYHGSKMTVLKSTCSSYVGFCGIVVMDTKNCFKLLSSDNIVRTVPKSSCFFKFKLEEFEFTFYGKNLQVRPAERSSKKLKTVYVFDSFM